MQTTRVILPNINVMWASLFSTKEYLQLNLIHNHKRSTDHNILDHDVFCCCFVFVKIYFTDFVFDEILDNTFRAVTSTFIL